ncbi:MAG: hypothetical protein EXS36_16815 [Pedosphaera sp.]|nr:hypothetical protein [Pedosphaera sp.]
MRLRQSPLDPGSRFSSARGSALIITLWVAFGLVSLALYFGNSSSLELRVAGNFSASMEAAHAIDGAARYAALLLSKLEQPGVLPDIKTYQREAVPVGDSTFWFIGRDDRQSQITTDLPYFALVDEASKLNLNTATAAMLQLLPRMTTELAAAIVDWRDTDSDISEQGAEDEAYLRRNPAYHCKNAPFESIDELKMVIRADAEILYGEDLNRNGVLDINENDGVASLPLDDRNGRLDPGILEYVTVASREPLTTTNGTRRINVQVAGFTQQLATVLNASLGSSRANAVLARFGGPGTRFNSVLEFFVRSGMTVDEFAQIEADVYSAPGNNAPAGLVNVNTASEAVLACIPGIGTQLASSVVAYRQSNPSRLNTVAWAADVLGAQNVPRAGRYLTGRSYQFSADIAGVGPLGRGYRRTRFMFDLSEGTPRISYVQDLTDLGWALGKQVRLQQQQLAMNSR